MTDSGEWRPLGFEGESDEGFSGLTDGIPNWLSQSFWDWMTEEFSTYTNRRVGNRNVRDPHFNIDLLRKAERICRFQVPFNGTGRDEGLRVLCFAATNEGNELRLADFVLGERSSARAAAALETLLLEAGSAWAVGTRSGRTGLVRRVLPGVQIAAEDVMKNSGHAGARLADAWTAAFGIDPDPSRAYSLAIKAIEDATIPVVAPSDRTATLGKIIGQIRADADWTLPFQREDPDAKPLETMMSTMKMLWAGQADRHGGNPDPSLVITQAAAEAAVLFAVPLVYAFSSGVAFRKI